MNQQNSITANSTQLLLVISRDWNASTGRLFRYERKDTHQQWKLLDSWDVSLGKNGLGWGTGSEGFKKEQGPLKREGDLRAPAGVFPLRTSFGYANAGIKVPENFPYLPITVDTLGIDDPNSIHYNTILDQTRIQKPDWRSAEKMLRPDGLYRMGIVVDQNSNAGRQHPGEGSCIFLHIWRGPGAATVGCTAMPASRVEELLYWLNTGAHPCLVQLPAEEYERLSHKLELPSVPLALHSLPLFFAMTFVMGRSRPGRWWRSAWKIWKGKRPLETARL